MRLGKSLSFSLKNLAEMTGLWYRERHFDQQTSRLVADQIAILGGKAKSAPGAKHNPPATLRSAHRPGMGCKPEPRRLIRRPRTLQPQSSCPLTWPSNKTAIQACL